MRYGAKVQKGIFDSVASRKIVTDDIDLRFQRLLENKDYRWQKILEELGSRQSFGKASCINWLSSVEFLGLQNARLELKCSEEFKRNYVEQHFLGNIKSAAKSVDMSCEVVVLKG